MAEGNRPRRRDLCYRARKPIMRSSDASPTFVVNQRMFWFFSIALVVFGALIVAFGLEGGEGARDDAAVFTGAVLGGMGVVGAAILLVIPTKRITLGPDGMQIGRRLIAYDRLRVTAVELRDLGEVSAHAFDIHVVDASGQRIESIAINDRRWHEFDRMHAALVEAVRARGGQALPGPNSDA